jgi:hypothetical protein
MAPLDTIEVEVKKRDRRKAVFLFGEQTMIAKCQHTLYNGHPCRRIPSAGQRFCPAHRSRRRREDDTFDREIELYTDTVEGMDLIGTLQELEDTLVAVRARLPRSGRIEFHRLAIAVGFAQMKLQNTAPVPDSEQADAAAVQEEILQLLQELS